jgi:hypothetical protein
VSVQALGVRRLALLLVVVAVGTTGCGDYTDGGGGHSGGGSGFCASHDCIDNFYNGTGSIVKCADGMWSHSGGRPGACSGHGGESGY